MTIPILRPFQEKLVADANEAWNNGAQNVLMRADTGAGKTVTLSFIIRNHIGWSAVIAHRQELVGQLSLTLARYGVRHDLICSDATRRMIAKLHVEELGYSMLDPGARCIVASVDTLIRRKDDPRYALITLWVVDEGHHLVLDNKWHVVVERFTNPAVRGLLPTATPKRTDGKGLGRGHGGVADVMIQAPPMRWLIEQGYLCDYRIFCPPTDMVLLGEVGKSGDWSTKQLREAAKRSHIVGDVVKTYLRYGAGKLWITFAPDVETATEMTAAYRRAGVRAETLTGKTDDFARRSILKRFAARQIDMIVAVDIISEGFDLPAIEGATFARRTESLALYCLDPETEILTPNGWKGADEIEGESDVFGYDVRDGSIRSVPIDAKIRRPLMPDELIFGISSPHLDVRVSDNHDMLVRSNLTAPWRKEKAQDTAARRGLFRVPVAGFIDAPGADLSEADLSFIGWFLADGTKNKTTRGLLFSQAANKITHITHLRSAIEKCGFKYGEHVIRRKNAPMTHNDLKVFTVSYGAPRGRGKHLSGYSRLDAWLDKTIPPIFDQLTRDQFLTMLEALNLGDGVNQHGSLNYVKRSWTIACGDNRQMADRLQALAVTRGLRCHVSVYEKNGRGPWWTVIIKNVAVSTIAGAGIADGNIGAKKYVRSRFTEQPDRPPFVWCVSNSLGTLITRRRGRVMIMGNCQQFGRTLRSLPGKDRAIIIDLVANVIRHQGPPDKPRFWSLERSGAGSGASGGIPYRICSGPATATHPDGGCFQPYERVKPECPFCGYVPIPASRSSPAAVDGDVFELDPEVLAELRKDTIDVDKSRAVRMGELMQLGGSHKMIVGNCNRFEEQQEAQRELRAAMAGFGGRMKAAGYGDSEMRRRFWFKFGIDVISAGALKTNDARELAGRINLDS